MRRNRTSATMRITWLLLSLGFLCQGVRSAGPTDSSVTDAKNATPTPVNTIPPSAAATSSLRNAVVSTEAPTSLPAVSPNMTPAVQSSTQATTQPAALATDQTTTPQPTLAATLPTTQPTTVGQTIPAVAAAATTNPGAATTTNNLNKTPDPATITPTPSQSPTDKPALSSSAQTSSNAVTTPPATAPPTATTAGSQFSSLGTSGNAGATTFTQTPTEPSTLGRLQPGSNTTVDANTSPGNSQGGGGATTGPTSVQTIPKSTVAATVTAAVTGRPIPPNTASPTAGTSMATASNTVLTTVPPQRTFSFSLNNGHEAEDNKALVDVCRRLLGNMYEGNCSLTLRHNNGELEIKDVEISGKVNAKYANEYYKELTKTPTDNRTLIAILASCGALLIMIVILAVCASHHRKPYNENQQHLTEELHTVENGYHDNPTLEVMEVQPEMQEKKMALNGEFNDSWIVPMDNLLKEDILDEEDTHL